VLPVGGAGTSVPTGLASHHGHELIAAGLLLTRAWPARLFGLVGREAVLTRGMIP
jgi:hypothetical protein